MMNYMNRTSNTVEVWRSAVTRDGWNTSGVGREPNA